MADAALAQLRAATLAELRDALPAGGWAGVEACMPRLRAALPDGARIAGATVLVAYGGGKDSAYTIAFVRAMQLELFRADGATFKLRVVTNRHAGMPRAVMENVHRSYAALRIDEDPDCEALLVDGDEVRRFDVDAPRPAALVARNRLDILMTGHRTHADGRPTFCNACNFSVANSFGLAAVHDGGVDVIVTGDSPAEQRAYLAWIRGLAQRLGVAPARPRGRGFPDVLATIDGIAGAYFADVHGADAHEVLASRRVAHAVPRALRFFSIYDDTAYASGDHWELLTGFLGFAFDELAFSFTESDCANPALMAHLRGLKAERLFGRGYDEGLAEYVDFATALMRRKEFPPELVELVAARYRGSGAVERMRAAMDAYARETFGLDEQQLVCMACSPFAGEGGGLERFLAREHPALAGATARAHALLAGEADEPALAASLERISGLTLAQLRALYRRPLDASGGGGAGTIAAILDGDPHKAVIATRHAPDGPLVEELISGR